MFIVGLTGGIATGKSTVSTVLEGQDCVIIDADVIARQVVAVGTKGWKRIRSAFGENICLSNGEINRPKLGAVIFRDAAKRRQLNSITHPLIRWEMCRQIFTAFFDLERYVILDAPLLVESKGILTILLSEIVIVYCNEENQLLRLMSRDSLSEEDARLRISSQISIETKKSLATHPLCFIDNNGHGDALMSQTIKLKAYLDKSWRPELSGKQNSSQIFNIIIRHGYGGKLVVNFSSAEI